MKRRDFLRLAGTAGLATALPGLAMRPAFADTPTEPQAEPFGGLALITIFAGGGWDHSSFADPRENVAINHWAANAPAGTAGNLRYAPIAENQAFFERYHDRLLVINGIDLQTNGHGSADMAQHTGALSGLPNLNALYAANVGAGLPMPWLYYSGNDTRLGLVPPTAVPDHERLLGLADPNRRDGSRRYFRASDMDLIEQARRARLLARMGRVDDLPFTQRKVEELYRARTDRGLLERLADVVPESLDAVDLAGDGHNRVSAVHRFLIAIQAGLCVTANLRTGHNYDSHGNHDANHETGARHLTRLLDYLWTKAEVLGISDRLVVHVTSDVGRTPWYNGSNGKDHWSNGSAWIMMANQPWTDRSVGLSGPAHEKLDIDPVTLQPSATGERLRTAHVQVALRRILGIDQTPLAGQFPLDVPEIDLLNPAYQSGVAV